MGNKKHPSFWPGVFFYTKLNSELFHRVFESLGGAELRGPASLDVDGLTRARIAALARGAGLRREDAKPGDRDLVSALKARNDRVNHCLDCALGVSLRGTENAVHLVYDVCFVHENLLIDNPRGYNGRA